MECPIQVKKYVDIGAPEAPAPTEGHGLGFYVPWTESEVQKASGLSGSVGQMQRGRTSQIWCQALWALVAFMSSLPPMCPVFCPNSFLS